MSKKIIKKNNKIVKYDGKALAISKESGVKKLLDYTKSCYQLFYGNKNIIDLTGYLEYNDTSNVTNMGSMFYNCTNLTTIPQLDTSNVTDSYAMFSGCSKLTTIPLLDTSNVTSNGYMFNNCVKLSKVDITHYKISSSSSNSYFCYGCYSLKAIIIRSFGSSYTLAANAFNNCYHLLGAVDSTYNPEGLKDGYIYVPRNMIETLSNATNWSTHASQFRALEDYTKDGTTTGEFDDEKAGLL